MMYKTVVFMALITADGEDEGIEFTVELPGIPQQGTLLSFEGATDGGVADFIDIVRMSVDKVEWHFAFEGDRDAGGMYRSEFRAEIEGSYLGKSPRSGQVIVDTLKQHSSVSEIQYPV